MESFSPKRLPPIHLNLLLIPISSFESIKISQLRFPLLLSLDVQLGKLHLLILMQVEPGPIAEASASVPLKILIFCYYEVCIMLSSHLIIVL